MQRITIQDPYNPIKTWLVKVYPCGHYYVSQAINGRQIYPFKRFSRKYCMAFVPGFEG